MFLFFQMDDEEEKYICPHHHLDIHTAECLCRHERIVRNIESGRPAGHISRGDSDVEELSRRFTNIAGVGGGGDGGQGEGEVTLEPPAPPDYESVKDCSAHAQNGYHGDEAGAAAGVVDLDVSGVGGGATANGGCGATDNGTLGVERTNRKESLIAAMASPIMTPLPSAPPTEEDDEEEEEEEEEVVWLRREEVNQEPLLKKSKPRSKSSQSSSSSSSSYHSNNKQYNNKHNNKLYKPVKQHHYKNKSFDEILPAEGDRIEETTLCATTNSPVTLPPAKMPRRGILKRSGGRGGGGGRGKSWSRAKGDQFARIVAKSCRREQSLALRKEIVVEWQTIATVIDRLLFWIFLLATVVAYLVILVFVPMTKPDFPNDMPAIHAFVRNTPPHS